MTWEWSHTNQTDENARLNLADKPRAWLEECLAEWKATKYQSEFSGNPQFRDNRYEKCLAYVKGLPEDVIIDAIWEKAEELRSCTNGGYMAHMCPYGCHMVSFDRQPEDTD